MKIRLVLIFTIISCCLKASAQCAMCRAVLESEAGQTTAKGVNDGIIYLMVIPYIWAAGIGYVIYRRFKKKRC